MNTDKVKTRKNSLLSHVVDEEKWRHSLMKMISMEERASFFLGIRRIEKSTKRHYCITLIQAKTEKSFNAKQN